MLENGTIVAGYRVDGTLGEGGMGVVYRATQLSLNRGVALKVLASELSDDVTFRERFRREGQLQAAIDHQHIVTVYEAGETEHGLFLAMRVVRGPTLKDEIQAGNLDHPRMLKILLAVADALDSAHDVGLIHRDVKPQNILVGARDHAFLADFGLTKVPDESAPLTGTGQFIGTIDYISPEQVQGEAASVRSDVYALAGVLYECLTGQVPYSKTTEAAVLYAHMSDPPPQLSELKPDLPAELGEVIAKGMAKDPAQRYASAGELMRSAEAAFGTATREAVDQPAPGRAAPTVAAGTAATAPAGGAPVTKGTPQHTVARAAAGPPAATKPAAGATVPAAGATVPAEPRPASRAPLIAGAVAAVVAAAVIGLLVGGGSSSSDSDGAALSSSASAGSIGLSFPDDWARVAQPPEVPGLALSDPIGLGPENQAKSRLAAGQTDATGAALLPAAFVRRVQGEPEGERVKLGKLQAYRYADLRLSPPLDERLTVYASPTTGGVATFACMASPAQAEAFLPECERVAATTELSGVEALPLGPSKAYADAVSKMLGKLDSDRKAGLAALRRARTRPAQARAARSLSRAYRSAAGAASKAPAGPAERGANAALVRSLRRGQAAYSRLGSAAAGGDDAAYSAASRAVRRADAAVSRALQALGRLGYDVS